MKIIKKTFSLFLFFFHLSTVVFFYSCKRSQRLGSFHSVRSVVVLFFVLGLSNQTHGKKNCYVESKGKHLGEAHNKHTNKSILRWKNEFPFSVVFLLLFFFRVFLHFHFRTLGRGEEKCAVYSGFSNRVPGRHFRKRDGDFVMGSEGN